MNRVVINVLAGALYDRRATKFDFTVEPGTVGTVLDQPWGDGPLADWRLVEIVDKAGRAAWVPLHPSHWSLLPFDGIERGGA